MDMKMKKGTPWLDQPVMLHSSREATCKLTPEQCAYRDGYWRSWYVADHAFALSTVYLFVATIGVCMIGFWASRAAPRSLRRKQWWQKLVSSLRFLAYRHYDVKGLRWYTPSLGVSILLIIGAIFFLAMTLGPKPYYWPNTRTINYGNSPPIATRAGWMSLACLPFMVISSTKSNMIASLTGVSHDRLIVFHNWVGWAMFVLALVHTFPFIVYNAWQGDMVSQWKTSVTYWTGVAAIIPQFYLQVMSLPFIRNRYYEFFKATHYFVAAVFSIFFFLHCDFRLSSWDYFIAAGVLYAVSWLYSQMRIYFEYGVSHKATFEMVSDLCIKITIPINATWRPAQHVFLRFITPSPHFLTAHPFTICSAPSPLSQVKTNMVFYVKPRGGLTGRLANLATQRPGYTVPVLIDGPYGGIKGRPLDTYDQSLVIACGSGAGLSLGVVMDAIARSAECPKKVGRHKMQVVIASRDTHILEWYENALVAFLRETRIPWPADEIQIAIYQTGLGVPDKGLANDMEKQHHSKSPDSTGLERLPINTFTGRPDITAIIKDTTTQPDVSVGILTCGPAGVLKEAQGEAAAAQLRILGSKPAAREVYLHSEVFSW